MPSKPTPEKRERDREYSRRYYLEHHAERLEYFRKHKAKKREEAKAAEPTPTHNPELEPELPPEWEILINTRVGQKKTAYAVAYSSGMPTQKYKNWESRMPETFEQFKHVCDELGVTPNYLLGYNVKDGAVFVKPSEPEPTPEPTPTLPSFTQAEIDFFENLTAIFEKVKRKKLETAMAEGDWAKVAQAAKALEVSGALGKSIIDKMKGVSE